MVKTTSGSSRTSGSPGTNESASPPTTSRIGYGTSVKRESTTSVVVPASNRRRTISSSWPAIAGGGTRQAGVATPVDAPTCANARRSTGLNRSGVSVTAPWSPSTSNVGAPSPAASPRWWRGGTAVSFVVTTTAAGGESDPTQPEEAKGPSSRP